MLPQKQSAMQIYQKIQQTLPSNPHAQMVLEPAEAPGASFCGTPETYSASSGGAAVACNPFETTLALQNGAGWPAAHPTVTRSESAGFLTALLNPSQPPATPAASAVEQAQPAPVQPSADATLAARQACPFYLQQLVSRAHLRCYHPKTASFPPQPLAQAAAPKSDAGPLHQQQDVQRSGEVPHPQTASFPPQPPAQAATAKSEGRPLHKQWDVERSGEVPHPQTASFPPQPPAQAAAAKSDVQPLHKQPDLESSGEELTFSPGAPAAHHQQAAILHRLAPAAVSPAKHSSDPIIATGKAATAPHDTVLSAATSAEQFGPQKQPSRSHTSAVPAAPASAAAAAISPQCAPKVLSDIQNMGAIKHAAPPPTANQQVAHHQQAAHRSAGTAAGPSAEDNLSQPPGTQWYCLPTLNQSNTLDFMTMVLHNWFGFGV